MLVKKSTILSSVFLVFLLTEFYYIPYLSGHLRPVHLLAPLILLLFFPYVFRLFSSPLFWILICLVLINIATALISDTPQLAITSCFLLVANTLIAFSTAILLASGKVSLKNIHSAFVLVIVVSVVYGIIQVGAKVLTGINLGFTDSQIGQIQAGFAPAFRTEANGFAKFLNTAFLFTFPAILKLQKTQTFLIYSLLIGIGLMLSFTRSVLYTLPITLFLIFIWYQTTGQGKFTSRRPLIVIVSFSLVLILFITTVGTFNEYATHKIANFFNLDAVLNGASSSLRLDWQSTLIDAFIQSKETILIGNGWGQVYYYLGDLTFQPGGADIIIFLAYGGIFSGLFFFLMTTNALWSSSRMSKLSSRTEQGLYYQGIFFATLGLTLTGMVNGSLNAPEYWVIYGLAIHASAQVYKRRNAKNISFR